MWVVCCRGRVAGVRRQREGLGREPFGERQGPEDLLELLPSRGLPQTEAAVVAVEGPQPDEVAADRQFTGTLCLAGQTPTPGRRVGRRRDPQRERDEELVAVRE